MREDAILWRRLDTVGQDACRMANQSYGWLLEGTAVFVEASDVGCLQYHIEHDKNWAAQKAHVSGWVGARRMNQEFRRTSDGQWLQNGMVVEGLSGAVDIDLGFTPATNTSAVRRFDLKVGETQRSTAAWLDMSDWRLKPLDQTYERMGATEIAYRSATGFRATLAVNDLGFVTVYPHLWKAEDY